MRRQPTYEQVLVAFETPEGKAFIAKCQELADVYPYLSDEEICARLEMWFEERLVGAGKVGEVAYIRLPRANPQNEEEKD